MACSLQKSMVREDGNRVRDHWCRIDEPGMVFDCFQEVGHVFIHRMC